MFKRKENILPKKLFKEVFSEVTSFNFPWYYLWNSAHGNVPDSNRNRTYSFHHTTMRNKEANSWYNDKTLQIANIMKDKFKLDEYEVIRLRWGMTTNIGTLLTNNSHVDSTEEHKVILFYLNSTDGPTCFYDNENNPKEQNIPKENSAVMFEGNIYHASSKPVNFDRRIVLNINLVEVQNDK
jgi:hypothetical protein